jgi:arabinose-5-phosphate isomerase
LAKYSTYHIKVAVKQESDPLNLAPTSSTTAQLVMGDAIASALIEKRGFEAQDFAMFHPGGSLGKRLLMRVEDVMVKENLPVVNSSCLVSEALPIMTKGRLGVVAIVENDRIVGLMTSGDLRLGIQMYRTDFLYMKIIELMNPHPITIGKDASLVEAENIFKEKNLNLLIVADTDGKFEGLLNIKECQL